MKSPIIFLDRVVFPGQFIDVEVSLTTGQALLDLWNLERFGCIEAVIGFPEDTSRPASADNLAQIGICAELTVDAQDVRRERTRVRVSIGDSERARILGLIPAPAGYEPAWSRPFASWEPAGLHDVETDDTALAAVRAATVQLLTTTPDLIATREAELQRLPEAIVDLHAQDVAPWKIAYLVAELVLTDPSARQLALRTDEIAEVLSTLQTCLADRAQEAHASAGETSEAWLAAAADYSLQGALDSLQATRLLAEGGLIEVPAPLRKQLRRLHKELEQAQVQLYDLIEAMAEHIAPPRDDEEDEG